MSSNNKHLMNVNETAAADKTSPVEGKYSIEKVEMGDFLSTEHSPTLTICEGQLNIFPNSWHIPAKTQAFLIC